MDLPSAITPVPGRTGPVASSILLKHAVEAAKDS
nr:hypothetical protein [Paenibacillus pasadenensis]